MTARASDSMFLCIDFVRVTNCFYDYEEAVHGVVGALQILFNVIMCDHRIQ